MSTGFIRASVLAGVVGALFGGCLLLIGESEGHLTNVPWLRVAVIFIGIPAGISAGITLLLGWVIAGFKELG